MPPLFTFKTETTFQAAHDIEGMHGHTWKVEATFLFSVINPETNKVADFTLYKEALDNVARKVHNTILNEALATAHPTAEKLCLWFSEQLKAEGYPPREVTIYEGDESSVSYRIERSL